MLGTHTEIHPKMNFLVFPVAALQDCSTLKNANRVGMGITLHYVLVCPGF